jgi:hypothetical protein
MYAGMRAGMTAHSNEAFQAASFLFDSMFMRCDPSTTMYTCSVRCVCRALCSVPCQEWGYRTHLLDCADVTVPFVFTANGSEIRWAAPVIVVPVNLL